MQDQKDLNHYKCKVLAIKEGKCEVHYNELESQV